MLLAVEEPVSAKAGPHHEERKHQEPCDGDNRARKSALVAQVQKEITRLCSGIESAHNMAEAEDEDEGITNKQPSVHRPTTFAKLKPGCIDIHAQIEQGEG
mmetsp:Transcript_51583/g.95092  ORF Transcript_51583/g.95092 Transcript_51583/m.95092 type:complete len:101 (+) Transcript_51583:481-783(+)